MSWTLHGPRPGTGGQSEGITDQEIVGAVNAVVPHPSDADILYIGAVNGGVWRTSNARGARPDWVSLMSDEASLSIGALCLDKADATARTLVAGTGRFSSLWRTGGALLGVMRSTDEGATWTVHDNQTLFRSLHIRAIHAHGNVILLAANARGSSNASGVYRSTDAGQTFAQLTGGVLRAGRSFALSASSIDPDILYAQSGDAVYRTDDLGATWSRISSPAMEAALGAAGNVKIAPGLAGHVFVAIASALWPHQLTDLFHSADSGANWTALDLPETTEGLGASFGIHPGGQADIHFSLAADLTEGAIVYIGGDRQPAFNEDPAAQSAGLRQFPNSISARNYSGRLFRVDARQPSGQQANPITHINTGSGRGSPHADSRCLAIAADGSLIEGDDGGVYRRINPRDDTGDWSSVIGSLSNTEAHSGAWDASAGMMVVGTQDNGTLEQDTQNGARWPTVMGGDGGVVAVASLPGPAGGSVRYCSAQFLMGARRYFFDSNGQPVADQSLQLRSAGTLRRIKPQFYSPIQTNSADSDRLVICGEDAVWESFDQGDTIRLASPIGVQANNAASVAFGSNTNPDILYVGAGTDVFVRVGPPPTTLTATTSISSTERVTAVAMDPDQPTTVFAAFFSSVHRSDDSGQNWVDITTNLLAVGGRTIRSAVWCGNIGNGYIVVGTNAGVFASEGPAFTNWQTLGADLPAVPVMQLQYDATNQRLMVATLGRGAWMMPMTELTPPLVAAAGGAVGADQGEA